MEKFKAMTSPRSQHDEKGPQQDEMNSTKTSINDALGGNKILNNTSAVIQNTFQYIYDFEKKKMEKVVQEVEELFDSNPLHFNDEQVNHELDKIERAKMEKQIYKSFIQIHEEELAA